MTHKTCAIIGGGPAGLMAAERVASKGIAVTLYDRMPSVGRKFLMAGRGGLNLTHSEDLPNFMRRYDDAASWLEPVIQFFSPTMLRDWAHSLEQQTFIGTSGRVFPKTLKASPLLRAWLKRLADLGVQFKMRHLWSGWDGNGRLLFEDENHQRVQVEADATVLALGGASWPRLGSDGSWTTILQNDSIPVTPLAPSNSGFKVAWSTFFQGRYEGHFLKSVKLMFDDQTIQGDIVITAQGIEGGPVYALSRRLRKSVASGETVLHIDLRPGLSSAELQTRFATQSGNPSLSTQLKKAAGLTPVGIGLVNEYIHLNNLNRLGIDLAALIKRYPLTIGSPTSISRAISTAGGIAHEAFDGACMLKKRPGTFVAGEMLDWEAPTGGYLLQACFSTACVAANGVLNYLNKAPSL